MTSKQQPQQSIRLKIKFQAFKQKRGVKEVELFIQTRTVVVEEKTEVICSEGNNRVKWGFYF